MIELMCVMAIILILFVIYWGGGIGGGKAKKQMTFGPCSKNMQFIHTALLNYAADNNDPSA